MATAGMRVLVLAALAVGLLAAAVSGARDAMKVARGLVPEEGGAAGGVGAGQQRKGARILAAETFAHHAPLPDYLDHIPRRQALATTCGRTTVTIRSQFLSSPSLLASHFTALLGSHFTALLGSHFSAPFTSFLCSLYPSFLCSLYPSFLCSFTSFLCSPYLSFLCSPYLSFLCSPYLPFLCSPYLSFLCSPYLSFLCSPYLSFLCSPYLSFLCSPYLSFLCSPYLSVLCSLISRFSAFLTSLSLLCVTPIFLPTLPLIPLLPLARISLSPMPPCGRTTVTIRSQYLGPVWAHDACGRTTVTIRSQYLGPYDLHNDIYNMTFYNGCAYNVTSPLRVWQCFNFYNIWEGVLANPAPNPTQYQTGDIFVQTTPGYCEMRMNRGASGKLQMLPGETVNIVYAHLWDFRPCVQELRFGNGNSYSMTNTTECQLAKVI
ncbi:unnamed protein product [Closterium sp. Naga37s-1]|nr:unnamed protein product [Closterium sp. Naga37s-1]